MKIRFFIAFALLGTLLLTGCTTTDDDGAPPPRGESAKKSKKPAKRSGKKRRDPVDDMFFGLSKKDDTPDFSASELNKRERGALKESRKWQDEEMREIRRGHDRFNEERKARKRWVYGLKPEDLAAGVLNMVFQTIGMLAVFACRNEEMKDVILTGTLAQVPGAKKVFEMLRTMHGVNFIIPKNALYATATGAALSYLYKTGKKK